MNRLFLILILIAAIAGGVWWTKHHRELKPTEAKATEEVGVKITHDTNGNVVVHMPDEMQGNAGIAVSTPAAAQFSPELKGYGRVLDLWPLRSAFQELMAARKAFDYSHQELERMKVLKSQSNTSERAFQTAEETYFRDQAAMSMILVKLPPVWGEKLSDRIAGMTRTEIKDRKDDSGLNSLLDRESVLVRVDFPAGQMSGATDLGPARLIPLGENPAAIKADFFDLAPNVDPQTQARGLFFLLSDKKTHLVPGAAVTAFVQLPGPPLSGVIVPPEAVVRADGAAWVYVMGAGSDTFTRTEVSLDHRIDKGWFVANGITSNNYVVTTGAQIILSQETKPTGAPD